MKRHDDSQRSDRWPVMFGDVRVVDRMAASIASSDRLAMALADLADLRVVDRLAASIASLRRVQLTAPADRPLRAPAHAVAFSTGVAAGYDCTGPGSPPLNSPSQNRPPTSPAKHIRCSADHRPAWRCDAGPDVRRAVGVCMMGRARGSHLTSAIWQGTLCPKKEVKMILKEPHARAA